MNNISIPFKEYHALSELDTPLCSLIERAKDASQKAYAPFSHFKVGAAILLDSGEILSANNQESEALPSGICAERALLYHYQANFTGHKIVALAVFSPNSDLISPCGACRQVICDTEKRQHSNIKIIMAGDKHGVVVSSAKELLPFTFSL
ncbi:MAG: cytidine deaminase [Rikenellaceae bacterium]